MDWKLRRGLSGLPVARTAARWRRRAPTYWATEGLIVQCDGNDWRVVGHWERAEK